nr:vacuolar iron transporter like 4 [Quercus suber]
MAVNGAHDHQVSVSNVRVPVHANDIEQNQCQETEEDNNIDYYQRAQWLRAAVLGATDGLVSVALLMIGVGAVKKDLKPMLLAGFAGEKKTRNTTGHGLEKPAEDNLPNPVQAASASALAFSAGGLVPLLGAPFIKEDEVRHGMVFAVASIALVVFGVIGAKLGRTPVARSCFRVLVGGWMAMAITFGMIKLIGCSKLQL